MASSGVPKTFAAAYKDEHPGASKDDVRDAFYEQFHKGKQQYKAYKRNEKKAGAGSHIRYSMLDTPATFGQTQVRGANAARPRRASGP